jgi:hypothetical protein
MFENWMLSPAIHATFNSRKINESLRPSLAFQKISHNISAIAPLLQPHARRRLGMRGSEEALWESDAAEQL